jgi:hypothetical protein
MNSIERGERAQEVLENPLVKEALEEIEDLILQEWQYMGDKEARDELWYTMQGLKRFQTYFEAAIQSGKLDLAQLRGSENGI